MTADAHPTLPEFDYLRPVTIMEASRFLAQYPQESRPFMGGTDVFVRMRDGYINLKYLVDVKNLEGIQDSTFDEKTGLRIGAAVCMNRIIVSAEVKARYPLLVEACSSVASYQLRNRATLGGNICNASPAGDAIGACLVHDAELQIHGVDGFRQEKLASFFLGPGKTTLKPGDLVVAIQMPLPPPRAVGKYLKLGRNKLSDLALVGVTVLGFPDPAVPSGVRIRIALASVAPIPLLVPKAEEYLTNQAITPAVIREAARLAAEACSPIDDVRGSSRYRKQMVKNLVKQALTTVWEDLNNIL